MLVNLVDTKQTVAVRLAPDTGAVTGDPEVVRQDLRGHVWALQMSPDGNVWGATSTRPQVTSRTSMTSCSRCSRRAASRAAATRRRSSQTPQSALQLLLLLLLLRPGQAQHQPRPTQRTDLQ